MLLEGHDVSSAPNQSFKQETRQSLGSVLQSQSREPGPQRPGKVFAITGPAPERAEQQLIPAVATTRFSCGAGSNGRAKSARQFGLRRRPNGLNEATHEFLAFTPVFCFNA